MEFSNDHVIIFTVILNWFLYGDRVKVVSHIYMYRCTSLGLRQSQSLEFIIYLKSTGRELRSVRRFLWVKLSDCNELCFSLCCWFCAWPIKFQNLPRKSWSRCFGSATTVSACPAPNQSQFLSIYAAGEVQITVYDSLRK